MGNVTKTKTWVDNDTVNYTDINANFDSIYNEFNGHIENANIDSDAAIEASKISGTAATLTATQTLTNKTLTSPTITGPTISGTVAGSATYTKPTVNGSVQGMATASDGATVTFDLAAANIQTVTLGGNRTLALSNVSVGQCFILRLVQDGTGSRTVTWFSTIKWPDGTTPTLTTTAAKTDVFGFICTSSGNYDGFIVGQNL